MPGTITVTGFLGAGKSALADRLRQALPGRGIVEASGGDLPALEAADGPVVAVADAANLPGCLGDALVGPLVAAQLRAAGLLVLSRTDLVPAGPALDALAALTDAPVVEAPPGDLPAGLAGRIAALGGWPDRHAGPPAAPVRFAEWRYAGPATVRGPALEALLEKRPPGLYRLSGRVRSGKGGLEVEAVGRLRQTRPIPQPAETVLVAIGPRARFRPDHMALAFSDAVAAAGWLSGLFGHR